MTINVPASFKPLLEDMSSQTGIPYAVEAAQADYESGFNAQAKSSAGALGWLQFLPSTYDEFTQQAGVPTGTEFNPSDESKVYIVYMNSLLKQYKGDVRNALAAYNAGTASSPAGQAYASHILNAAGTGNIVTDGGAPSQAQTTGILTNPFDIFNRIFGISFGSLISGFLKVLGLGSIADLFERLGLIILGTLLLLIGIHILANGKQSQVINVITGSGSGSGSGPARAAEGEAVAVA